MAYEPVWAIGTGRAARDAGGRAAPPPARGCCFPIGAELRILYGGSVTPENAADLLAGPGVDGFLIGGREPVGRRLRRDRRR